MFRIGDLYRVTSPAKRVSSGKSTRYVKYPSEAELPPYNQEEKVIDMLKNQDSIANLDVQRALGINVGSANVLLSWLTKKGVLVRVSRGKYSLRIQG